MKTGRMTNLTRMIRTKELVSTATRCIMVNAGSRIKSNVTDVANLVTLLETAPVIYRTRLDLLFILQRIKYRGQPTCSMPLIQCQNRLILVLGILTVGAAVII